MYKRLKVKIYPTYKQIEILENHFNAFRYCYNLCLEYKKILWFDHRKNVSGYDMGKELLQIRKQEDWLLKCKAECIREAGHQLDKSYKKFYKGKGFPKFKSRKGEQSFHAYQNINIKGNRVTFYKNSIKFKTSKHYEEQLEISKIKKVTFKKDLVGDYWATFLIEDKTDLTLPKKDNHIGVDLGIKDLAITSEGEVFENNRYLQKQHFKLRKLQRKFAKTKKGGKNREKLRVKIAKVYRKVLRQKEHHYHQITNKLIRENQTIVIETLKVKKMIEKKKLSREISDVSWGMFTNMLEYKANWCGRDLIKVDTYFPSSKKCSSCGNIKEELKLSQRQYKCDRCNTSLDRDLNAALNILQEGLRLKQG